VRRPTHVQRRRGGLIERAFELDAVEARSVMAENCNDRAARGIAAETEISPAVARRLVASSSVEVRVCLAGNGSLPPELLEQLLQDPDPQVRVRAEWNPAFERTFEMPRYSARRDNVIGTRVGNG